MCSKILTSFVLLALLLSSSSASDIDTPTENNIDKSIITIFQQIDLLHKNNKHTLDQIIELSNSLSKIKESIDILNNKVDGKNDITLLKKEIKLIYNSILDIEKANQKEEVNLWNKAQSNNLSTTQSRKMVITAWSLSAKRQPNNQTKAVKYYHIGDTVTIIKKVNDKYSLLDNGLFIQSRLMIPRMKKTIYRTIADDTRERKQPHVSDNIIVRHKEKVEINVVATLPNRWALLDNGNFIHLNSLKKKD